MNILSYNKYTNANQSNYSSSSECNTAFDGATGSIVRSGAGRFEELKKMLDSNKDSLKLDAMKRIIQMITRGKDMSDLFAPVVKNVVSKNSEIKRLVCLYVIRYAEEKQDVALLSIAALQRALKEPNQYIRSNTIATLSSIRVPLISGIIFTAVCNSANDLSPYVRKMAAIAICKIYPYNIDKREQLIDLIKKLLCDNSLLVLNTAILAMYEICPERYDLLHYNFRYLCKNLLDFDYWAQTALLQILTRYGRIYFVDHDKINLELIGDENLTSEQMNVIISIESDYKLLLNSAKLLFYSNSTAVNLGVIQLYYHLAKKSEMGIIVKPLLRGLYKSDDVKLFYLDAIVTISSKHKDIFLPYVKNFLIRYDENNQIKNLKLHILTNLISDSNKYLILNELQTYLSTNQPILVQYIIQAIGRCASASEEIKEVCIHGLMALLSYKNESVVAESIVVLRQLLHCSKMNSKQIISRLANFLQNLTIPKARVAILCLLNEYCDLVPLIIPDILRMLAKSFPQEDYSVKLQIINLVLKAYVNDQNKYKLLFEYIMNLAKYDISYDLRDKVRLYRNCQKYSQQISELNIKNIVLRKVPASMNHFHYKEHQRLQIGTLSYFFDSDLHACHVLPNFCNQMPDCNIRDNNDSKVDTDTSLMKNWKFTENNNLVKTNTSNSSIENHATNKKKEIIETEKSLKKSISSDSDSSDHSDSTGSSINSESDSNSESETETEAKIKQTNESMISVPKKSNIDLLLELENDFLAIPLEPTITNNTNDAAITSNSNITVTQIDHYNTISAVHVSFDEITLLDAINGNGLIIKYRFTRNINFYSPKMVSISLTFTNTTNNDIHNIQISRKDIKSGLVFYDFSPIQLLTNSSPQSATLGIDFGDSIRCASFEISSSVGSYSVSINPTMGELIRPILLTDDIFEKEKRRLCGLNELIDLINTDKSIDNIDKIILRSANLAICQTNSSNLKRYSGVTISLKNLVLVSVIQEPNYLKMIINCEKMVIASVLLNEFKCVLSL